MQSIVNSPRFSYHLLKNTTVMDCGTMPENDVVEVYLEMFYYAKNWEIRKFEDKVKDVKGAISESKEITNVGRMKQKHRKR